MPRCIFDEDDAGAAAWDNNVTAVANRTVTLNAGQNINTVTRVIQTRASLLLDGSNQDFDLGVSLSTTLTAIWLNGIGGAAYAGLNNLQQLDADTVRVNASAAGGPTEQVCVVIVEYR